MREVLEFFRELHNNNNREWFDANRTRWKKIQAQFYTFTEGLIDGISSFDPSVKGLAPKDCVYRIARDTRFSPDKSPYKTYIGTYVAPGGKNSGYAGYYLHIEPCCDSILRANALISGLHCPEPVVLRSVRDEIMDNGAEIAGAVCEAKGFRINESNKLKRTPVGFPRDTEYDELLKLKDVYIEKRIDEEFLLAPDLLERTLAEFRRTKHFVEILNRAVRFAHEEMM